ncbi:hypothetical protein Skr01_31790 [Sphaerisporangium krabiense]|nr:hypothetical protein Skr01_31790 [Sphaerisporangium krabiense]
MTDGPFTETKHLIADWMITDVESWARAVVPHDHAPAFRKASRARHLNHRPRLWGRTGKRPRPGPSRYRSGGSATDLRSRVEEKSWHRDVGQRPGPATTPKARRGQTLGVAALRRLHADAPAVGKRLPLTDLAGTPSLPAFSRGRPARPVRRPRG